MIPLAIPAIASVASTALETWGRVAEVNANARAQSAAKVAGAGAGDFATLMEKAKGVASAFQAQVNGVPTQAEISKQVASLPEVKAVLNSDFPGTQVSLSVSGQNKLERVLPGGTKQEIALSPESQAVMNQLAARSGGVLPAQLQFTTEGVQPVAQWPRVGYAMAF